MGDKFQWQQLVNVAFSKGTKSKDFASVNTHTRNCCTYTHLHSVNFHWKQTNVKTPLRK